MENSKFVCKDELQSNVIPYVVGSGSTSGKIPAPSTHDCHQNKLFEACPDHVTLPFQSNKLSAFLTAILLIVIHLSLSTYLITTPLPLLPSVLLLLSQNPRLAFKFSVLLLFSTMIFLWPSASRLPRWSGSCLCSLKCASLDCHSG